MHLSDTSQVLLDFLNADLLDADEEADAYDDTAADHLRHVDRLLEEDQVDQKSGCLQVHVAEHCDEAGCARLERDRVEGDGEGAQSSRQEHKRVLVGREVEEVDGPATEDDGGEEHDESDASTDEGVVEQYNGEGD